ncbi:right-handed parallel beta-helix repeat-containing protein [Jannaschia marina]|uniref:right-handed parallel beta-helix repeat-containing protein n=1 Tax=Jannaschia marina TaxID=2741674 RepID=UPI0015C8596E|nr:right-handed parallel beta-helix repeat-containing protein [Jannaschia marina]
MQTIFRAPLAAVMALALSAALWDASPATAETTWADPATLETALETLQPGDTLALRPGRYPRLHLTRGGAIARPVTLRAADAENPPVFPGLILRGADHVVLDGLAFHLPGGTEVDRRFARVEDAQDVTLRRLRFLGARRPDDTGVPRPWGFGLSVTDGTDIEILDSEFSGFARGLVASGVERLTVARNLLHGMRVDGMNFAEVGDVLIEDNEIRDFDRVEGAGDHPDMIQFWTRGTERPSTGITIRRNVLNSGTGSFTQSIFMRNELIDTHQAGEDMFYRDVVIEENVILNAHLHGITVGATLGLTIRRNTVARNASSDGPYDNRNLWTPRINVASVSRDVLILGNVVHGLPEPGWDGSWTMVGNQIVQDRIPGQRDHYDQVFFGVSPETPAMLADFAARPGGLLDGREIGAPRLVAISAELDKGAPAALPDPGARDMRGVIRLDPAQGAILSDGGAGSAPFERDIGGPTIIMGDTIEPLVLTREMTAPLFDASRFAIRMRLRARGDFRTAGEILRLHQSLMLRSTGRGAFEIDVRSAEGGRTILKSRPTRLYRDDEPLELIVAYDGPVGMVSILINGETVGRKPFTGTLRPVQSWGLSFGNPFGTKLSFDGVIEEFEVRTDPGDLSDVFSIIDTSFVR